jgi:hypothetical protein
MTTEKVADNPNYGLKINDIHPLTPEWRADHSSERTLSRSAPKGLELHPPQALVEFVEDLSDCVFEAGCATKGQVFARS